jgi:hypothetical protein
MLNTFKRSRDLYKNRPWLTFLALVTLGTMVLAVCSLLLGCGSDSTPKGSLKGKNAKTAGLGAKKSGAVAPLIIGNKGMDLGARKIAKQPQDSQQIEAAPPGMTVEELNAKTAAQTAAYNNRDPNLVEVSPGVTLKQLQAKTAAQRATHYNRDPSLIEVSPGMTLKQLQEKMAAQRAAHYNRNPDLIEVSPGMTLKQLKAKAAMEQANRPQDMVPPAIIK